MDSLANPDARRPTRILEGAVPDLIVSGSPRSRWVALGEPRPEDQVIGEIFPESDRPDLELCEAIGEHPTAGESRERFPAFSPEVDRAFADPDPISEAPTVVAIAALAARDIVRSRETIQEIMREHEKTKQSEALAVAAGKEARREATENLRRLVKSAVGNGNRLVEDGNPLIALPWYVHALKNDPGGLTAEQRHRIRLAAVLGTAPGVPPR